MGVVGLGPAPAPAPTSSLSTPLNSKIDSSTVQVATRGGAGTTSALGGAGAKSFACMEGGGLRPGALFSAKDGERPSGLRFWDAGVAHGQHFLGSSGAGDVEAGAE